jgi:WD40 repeat protein
VAAVVIYKDKEDKQWVISGGWDKSIKVWDLMSGQLLRTLNGHSQGVTALALVDSGGARSGAFAWPSRLGNGGGDEGADCALCFGR